MALSWARLAQALTQGLVDGAQVPPRHVHRLGRGPAGEDSLLLMPAWNRRVIGHKLVTVMPGNPAAGRPTVGATYLLLDRASGEPLALLDGEALTLRRTAAMSALAASRLARPDAQRLLIVGAGRLAPWMLRAHVASRPGLSSVAVWGRRPEAAQAMIDQVLPALAQELAASGRRLPTIEAVASLAGAVTGADIVSCATTSTQPLILGRDLRPGTHLDLAGGFRPDMREADDEAVAAARVVVDTAQAWSEAGDLVQPMAAGRIGRDHPVIELAALLRADDPGRRDAGEITVFKSVGTALADLVAAQAVAGLA